MNNGFIYLWRKIMESSFYRNPNCCHLAIHLLLKVNHFTNKFLFNGEELIVEKGTTITGRKRLVEETGLSERNIRTCLKLLEKIGFLTIKTTNKFSIISISKYNEYQNNDQQTDQQTTNKRPTNDQQTTTNNNDNNDNNDNKRERPLFLKNSYKYLEEVPIEDIETFKKNFIITEQEVREKAQSLLEYCRMHGKVYKDYTAFLRNAIAKDFKKTVKPVSNPIFD